MNLYGFYFTDGTWALARGGRLRERIKLARERRADLYRLRHAYGYGSPPAWDAPTFRVTADRIGDYRQREDRS